MAKIKDLPTPFKIAQKTHTTNSTEKALKTQKYRTKHYLRR